MVRIGRVEPVQDQLADVGLVVAVGVFEEHHVRLGADIDAAVAKLDAGRQVQLVGEDRPLISLAVAVGVFEDQDFVVDRHTWNALRVRRHAAYPQSPAAVEGELHGLFQFGEFHFRSEQVHFITFGQLEFLPRFFGRIERDRFGEVGFDFDQLARMAIVDLRGNLFPLGNGPDPTVAVRDHGSQLGELGREVDDAERRLAAAVDVGPVDGPIVVEELLVLFVHRRPKFFIIGALWGRGPNRALSTTVAISRSPCALRWTPLMVSGSLAC